ncbi:MAG TPA: thioredoxin domain-containing protein [Bacteroidia bacterium]|nr:thioredoxin domain-containing protein [Bacteroidia bacterium]
MKLKNIPKKITLAALLIVGISVTSCQSQTKGNSSKQINITIAVDEFDKKLSETKDVQLVDVRTPEEYQEGHLKNALNYNINGDDFNSQLSKLDKTKPVMVYCLGGGRSAEAAKIMEEKGFTEVYNMQGGIMKWNAANKPLDNVTASTTSTGLSVDDFNKILKTEKFVLVDYNAKWCKPCKKMAPMLDAIADKKKEKLTFIKIDADENKTLLKEKKIEAIPVLELYKNGKLIWKHEGEIDEATLLKETNL